MKDLIICLAVNSRDNYVERLKGLEASLIGWHGDVRIYKEFPDGCRHQSEVPYAFKYDLILMARKDGYKRIFWLDSVMRLVPFQNISFLLDESRHGIVAFDNLGHPLEKWINDTAIRNLEIKNLKGIKQCWGGALFFDFNKETAINVFREIMRQITIGSFNEDNTARENFNAHRHDQAVVSGLLNAYGVELLPYGKIVSAEHARTKEYGNDYYIIYGD